MPRKNGSVAKTIRASAAEWDSWREAALLAGLPLNAWIRRALSEAAEMELALSEMEPERRAA